MPSLKSCSIYKGNRDIALESKQKRMGIGVVIRGDQGRVTAALCQPVEILPDSVIGKAMGALGAVEFCRDLELKDIILEGDSKMVVDAIIKKGPSQSTYGHIMENILEVLKVFKSCAAGLVKRTAD
jgi:ribonuclease HI